MTLKPEAIVLSEYPAEFLDLMNGVVLKLAMLKQNIKTKRSKICLKPIGRDLPPEDSDSLLS